MNLQTSKFIILFNFIVKMLNQTNITRPTPAGSNVLDWNCFF